MGDHVNKNFQSTFQVFFNETVKNTHIQFFLISQMHKSVGLIDLSCPLKFGKIHFPLIFAVPCFQCLMLHVHGVHFSYLYHPI